MNNEKIFVGKLHIATTNKSFKKATICDYQVKLCSGGIFYISKLIENLYYSPTPNPEIGIRIYDLERDRLRFETSGLLLRDKNEHGFYEYFIENGDMKMALETALFNAVDKLVEIVIDSDLEDSRYAEYIHKN